MNKTEFSEKYKDPRWQKKRLEVMQRSDFKCDICKTNNKTLNAHHKYYISENDPWDYEDKCFSTYCDDCHKYEHECKDLFDETLRDMKTLFTFRELALIFDAVLSEYSNKEKKDFYMKAYLIHGIRSGVIMNIGESIMKSNDSFLKRHKEREGQV